MGGKLNLRRAAPAVHAVALAMSREIRGVSLSPDVR
jgi:hypothetical protein